MMWCGDVHRSRTSWRHLFAGTILLLIFSFPITHSTTTIFSPSYVPCLLDLTEEEEEGKEGIEGGLDVTPGSMHTSTPEPPLQPHNPPISFDWRNVHGVNFLSPVRNHHAPQYCGACWAFNTLGPMADRIKIMRRNQWPDVFPSAQVLLNCATHAGNCRGGHPGRAFEYLHKYGVPDETCAPYEAKPKECTPINVCRDCNRENKCSVIENPPMYSVEEYGRVYGVENILEEIYARGPVSCGVSLSEQLYNYTGGILNDTSGNTKIAHLVSLVGWGVKDGVPYWIARNSWGSHWGEMGFFRIVRGSNNLGIEKLCYYMVPRKTWPDSYLDTDTDVDVDVEDPPSAERIEGIQRFPTKRSPSS